MDRIGVVRENLAELQELCPKGFAVALHVNFTTPRFLFQTYERDWMREYSSKGMVLDDPTVRWGLEHEGLIDWAELETDDAKGVLAQARAHGLNHGFTLALVDTDSRSVGSFVREDRAFRDEEKEQVQARFRSLHEATLLGSEQAAASMADFLKSLSVELTHR